MAMQQDRLISGDNHIDLTYCPPDLWSAQAPDKWKLLAPRTEELDDGLHWFVEAQDKGMWNGVGPGFLPYTKGSFAHIDEMKDAGFEWDYQPRRQAAADHAGAAAGRPRPRRARRGDHLRLPDDQRDDRRPRPARRGATASTTTGRPTSPRRSDPNRVFPLAIIPNNDPAARRRPRCGAAPSWGCAAATSPSSA